MKSKLKTHTNIKRGGLVACALIGLLMWANCWGATYYCSPSGSDSLSTDIESPGSLSYAMLNVSPRDVVMLLSGNYGYVEFNNTTSVRGTDWDNAITYKAQTGNTPVFQKIKVYGKLTYVPYYMIFDGITIQSDTTYSSLFHVHGASDVKILNSNMTGIGINGDIESSWVLAGVYLDDLSSGDVYYPHSITVENCTITGVGYPIDGSYNTGDTTYKDNTIYNYYGSAIRIGNSTEGANLIQGNHIYNQASTWQDEVGGTPTHGSQIVVRYGNCTIRGNHLHHGGRTGCIYFYDGAPVGGYEDIVIENNLIYCPRNQYAIRCDDEGEIGDNFVFRNNTVLAYKNEGDLSYACVLAADESTDFTTWEIHNNLMMGIMTIPDDSDIKESYNIMWDSGIFTPDGTDTVISDSELQSYITTAGNIFCGGVGFSTYAFPEGFVAYTTSQQNLFNELKPAFGSIVLNSGDSSYAPATDILGVTRGASVSVGCFENASVPSDEYMIIFLKGS